MSNYLAHNSVLVEAEAATYVGCKNIKQFRRELKAGYWPKPMAIPSRPKRWLKQDLDKALVGFSTFGMVKLRPVVLELEL